MSHIISADTIALLESTALPNITSTYKVFLPIQTAATGEGEAAWARFAYFGTGRDFLPPKFLIPVSSIAMLR